ncbi:hypothetical protein V498_01016 [Pseudogymnoascus sp. VKM F-4517 (FW-2822)]|nr:hypothetical protein V498_01016 [Pseudogymnoascus sp. VKM F-4517 (FW-2822)]
MPPSLIYTIFGAYYVEKYTDMGEGNCCSKCSRGASKDQRSIPNLAPLLSSGECKLIIFGPSSPQGLPLRVSRIYGIVRFEATIPASNDDNPQPITYDIPVHGTFDRQNNPLVQSLMGIVDSYFVPKIIGKTREHCDLIATACRGFGLCKLLIMAQGAQFESSELKSNFIWLVVQQIDELLQMSLLEVRFCSPEIGVESSSRLIIWYYAMSKLRESMRCAKRGQHANLFGSRELFQHVQRWVGHVWDELSNRWKTACQQHSDFYKGFRTPHEEIAKLVHNFTVCFEMSMWELPKQWVSPLQWESPPQWQSPAQPSGPVIYNGFHRCELPTDWASTQQPILPTGEAYNGALISCPNIHNLEHQSVTTLGSSIYSVNYNSLRLDGSRQPSANGYASRYSESDQTSLYHNPSSHLGQHPGNFQNSSAGYGAWPPESQAPIPAMGGTMGISPAILIPEKSRFSYQEAPFYQQPYIQIPAQSDYWTQMLFGSSINNTFRDADTTPGPDLPPPSSPFVILYSECSPVSGVTIWITKTTYGSYFVLTTYLSSPQTLSALSIAMESFDILSLSPVSGVALLDTITTLLGHALASCRGLNSHAPFSQPLGFLYECSSVSGVTLPGIKSTFALCWFHAGDLVSRRS